MRFRALGSKPSVSAVPPAGHKKLVGNGCSAQPSQASDARSLLLAEFPARVFRLSGGVGFRGSRHIFALGPVKLG